ncbi:hypothetical protein JCM33374_g6479 [Metschnikowia sp. JCM 33374]|nr:hypothetical protein JCM33374_g6479 [Metschnikowia sp. JCM 33374]
MANSNINCGDDSLSLLAEKISDELDGKFRQMYCIFNGAVPIQFAILDLDKIVQTCFDSTAGGYSMEYL